MTYTIIRDEDFDGLIDRVNEKIEQGWEPLGGVAYSESQGVQTGWSTGWAQAMVKKVFDSKRKPI